MSLLINWFFPLRFFCWFLLFLTLHVAVPRAKSWSSFALYEYTFSWCPQGFKYHLCDKRNPKLCISNWDLSLSQLRLPTWYLHLEVQYPTQILSVKTELVISPQKRVPLEFSLSQLMTNQFFQLLKPKNKQTNIWIHHWFHPFSQAP